MNKCDICSESNFDRLWQLNGFDIMQCRNCGLILANVTERNIMGIYEEDYYKSVYPDYESDKNIHDLNNIKLLEKIEKYFPPGTMIEIGSAFGFFLEIARKRKWEAVGYEMSEYASGLARTKYRQDVRTADFLTDNIQTPADVICMFDTIEHLLKPSLYIEKIYSTLKNNGGLIVTTGDISSWFARISGRRWRMLVPPLHIYYYSRKTITTLLEKYGFKILAINNDSKYQNFNSILKYQFGINKQSMPQLPIKVNAGDIMQVIARKS